MRAAFLGDAQAMFKVASMCEFGFNYQSADMARSWYQKASALGDLDATYSLALMYLNGVGGKRDVKRAYEGLGEAARLGHQPSIDKLALESWKQS